MRNDISVLSEVATLVLTNNRHHRLPEGQGRHPPDSLRLNMVPLRRINCGKRFVTIGETFLPEEWHPDPSFPALIDSKTMHTIHRYQDDNRRSARSCLLYTSDAADE